MTNEEVKAALIIMRDNCVKVPYYADPMLAILTVAIRAIENQPKYEKALAMACDKISCLYCVLHDSHPCEETHEQCVKRKIQYFKKKAGIEVPDNDE